MKIIQWDSFNKYGFRLVREFSQNQYAYNYKNNKFTVNKTFNRYILILDKE